MKQIDIREGARRQHRASALFAVIQCWLRNLDGVAFSRLELGRLLGLERFKWTRLEWLREDFREFFPYQETFVEPDTQSFRSLFISKIPLAPHLPTHSLSTQDRINAIPITSGIKIGIFEMWDHPPESLKILETNVPFFANRANYDERFLSSYLSLLIQGQISPRDIPPFSIAKEI